MRESVFRMAFKFFPCGKSLGAFPLALAGLVLLMGMASSSASEPMAQHPNFSFRKVKMHTLDRQLDRAAHPMVRFEQSRLNYGAITPEDFRERRGQYFDFFWRSQQTADVVVRFEFRQAALGPFVQTREFEYTGARGGYKTSFQITGDAFEEFGSTLAWRALLLVDDVAVAETRSYLWR